MIEKPPPDPRDWARKILDRVERGEQVESIAVQYAHEALVGHPRHKAVALTAEKIVTGERLH